MSIYSKLASTAEAKEHQKRVIEKLKKENAVLVYHGLGSGKTLTALQAAETLGLPLTVVAPASIRSHFDEENKKYDTQVDLNTYSYNKPPDTEELIEGVLAFDEAHRMGRADSQRSRLPENLQAVKKLFLTGTPIRNDPVELIPLLLGMGVDIPKSPDKFREKYVEKIIVNPGLYARIVKGIQPGVEYKAKNLEDLKEKLEGKVDYYASGRDNYPSVEEEDILVPMSSLQKKVYKELESENPSLAYKIKYGLPPSKSESQKLNSFLSATRQIGNSPAPYLSKRKEFNPEVDEPKIQKAFEEILRQSKADPNYKGITYSNYLESGVNLLEDRLKTTAIPYAKFTGKLTKTQKQEIVDQYNKGKIKHLLLSPSGGEGLDLKNTKVVQILEPHWNTATIDQVKGRAIRYKSHESLPEGEQKVKIQNFYATLPLSSKLIPKILQPKTRLSTDQYLKQLAQKKDNLNNQFLQALQEIGQ